MTMMIKKIIEWAMRILLAGFEGNQSGKYL
jgi:hypothetical protein